MGDPGPDDTGPIDPPHVRLSKTVSFLLRHRPDVGNLNPDQHGWVEIEALCVAAGSLLRTKVEKREIHALSGPDGQGRFEIRETRIRARRTRRQTPFVPDILYHATTTDAVDALQQSEALEGTGNKPVFLSADESQAWRTAHRLGGSASPAVLYVDAARARRHGAEFQRNRRNGLFSADWIPKQDILNLQPRFEEQLSAGGIPMQDGPDGVPRLALIRVTRRSGSTWEVAKGKLEPGEPPERTAVREVQEEMGIDIDMTIIRYLGIIRYGFLAPGRQPRLKTVFMFLMRPVAPLAQELFKPSEREGIGAVRLFTPAQAARAVRHSSLVPLMRRVRDILK